MARTVTFDVFALVKAVGFDELGAKISGIAKDSQTHVSALVTALAAVGPAAIPAGAAAVGALIGIAPIAGVALLALKGIEQEYKKGSYAGTQFGRDIAGVKTEIGHLKEVAASGVVTGMATQLHGLSSLFPTLNQYTAVASKQLGEIAGHVGAGLIALFTRLSPLFTSVGGQVVNLAAAFQRWATNSSGVTKFGDYAKNNLPRLEQILSDVAKAVGHIVLALGPTSGISFSAIGVFARFVSDIPVKTLQSIAPIISGVIVATKLWGIAAGALNVVLEANPFVRVATLILGVGAALVLLYRTSDKARLRIQGDLIDIGQVFVDAFTVIYDGFFRPIIRTFEGIFSALGHLPGALGKPFRAAKNALKGFDSDVQDMVNQANDHLSKMRARVQTEQAKMDLNDLLSYLKKTAQQRIEIDLYTKHINEFVTKRPGGTYTQNAAGGMMGEGWNLTGELGPEWSFKSGPNVQVFAHGTGGPQPMTTTTSRVTYVTVNVLNADPRATVRAIEQWAGSGGKIHAARAIT